MISLPVPRATPWGTMRAAEFTGDASLPDACDVAIIGGGLNGVITAWQLARRGVSVLLCEKAEIACESSGRAFGWVSELLLDPAKSALSLESKRLWRELQDDVAELGYRREGLAYLATNAEELGFYETWLDGVKGLASPDNRMLTAMETRDRFPGAARDWAGAILAPSDGGAEPQLAAPAMAQAARQAGARIMTGCAVRRLDVAAGQVVGIETELGRVRAGAVLFAGNAWSRAFLSNHGIDVPQLWFAMSMGRTGPVEGPVGCGGQEHWAWRRQVDGGYSLGRLRGQRAPITPDAIQLFGRFVPALKMEWRNIHFSLDRDARAEWLRPRRWRADHASPMEKRRALIPACDHRVPDRSLALNKVEYPALQSARVVEYWAGAITATPDNMPIAGPVRQMPGLWLLTGCSYGLTWAPALGKMLADLMTGRAPTLDPHPFRYERFFDGSATPLRH